MQKENMYIKIKAFDCSLLERCIRKFIDELKYSGAKLSGPIALPRDDYKFILNKSPHVDKKSREQFEMRVSKRLIVLYDPNATMMNMLKDFSFPAGVGVDIKVKVIKREE